MNQDTNDRIEKEAAERYAPGRFSEQWLKDRELDRQQAYIAGAEFATTNPEVLKELLVPFAEWLTKRNVYLDTNNGEELISKYISDTKMKEDGQQDN